MVVEVYFEQPEAAAIAHSLHWLVLRSCSSAMMARVLLRIRRTFSSTARAREKCYLRGAVSDVPVPYNDSNEVLKLKFDTT